VGAELLELIILIPAVACWIALAKWPIRKVLLNVYLPTVLLLPQYFVLRFPHLPPLSFADAAILPLGAALWFREMRRWRLDWMDLWVLLFALSVGLSEALSTPLATGQWRHLLSVDRWPVADHIADGGLQLFEAICTTVLPYMLGKLLIEKQGPDGVPARKRVVRRLVVLLALVAGASVLDFLTGKSLWQRVFRHFFPDQDLVWGVQSRWGFGRIQGPFAHAILAGMIFLMGLMYCLWLRMYAPNWGRRKVINGLSLTVRGVVLFAVVAGLLMTQSRGPWVGVGLALVLAVLMRTFSLRKALVAFLIFLAVFSAGAYYYGRRYTGVDINHAKTEEQRNAIYRRQLLDSYIPLIKQHKAFGWGITTLPTVNGQKSVDNQYLLVAATQGLTGLGLFLLILAGSGVRLFRLAAMPLPGEDRTLVLAHLTVLMGLVVSLTTVYLGEQALILLFFVIGWIHGMRPAETGAAAELDTGLEMGKTSGPEFRFQKVLI
jgi:hypothetical protein